MIKIKTGMSKYLVLLLLPGFTLSRCDITSNREKIEKFEKEMVAALGLKLFNHSPDYKYSRIEILHDTITGFYTNIINDQYYKYFFIQSINNPKKISKFNTTKLRYPSISHIDDYRNGCLYFGAYGLGFMQSLSSDGKLSNYFQKYNDSLFYANKVMLYKNKAVLTSMNGLYLFDISTQHLLWQYKFDYSPMEGLSAIIGNKLIFTESKSKNGTSYTEVRSLDLDMLRVDWETVIPNDADYLYHEEYIARYTLFHDKNKVIIPQITACYAVDLKNGSIVHKVPWKGFFDAFVHDPKFNVENNKLYVNNFKDNTTLLCIDMATNKVKWKIKNTYYTGLYKNFVVACTLDLKHYLIINKANGKIIHRISKYTDERKDFSFIDQYILINRETIYK